MVVDIPPLRGIPALIGYRHSWQLDYVCIYHMARPVADSCQAAEEENKERALECPKQISVEHIARLNREYFRAKIV